MSGGGEGGGGGHDVHEATLALKGVLGIGGAGLGGVVFSGPSVAATAAMATGAAATAAATATATASSPRKNGGGRGGGGTGSKTKKKKKGGDGHLAAPQDSGPGTGGGGGGGRQQGQQTNKPSSKNRTPRPRKESKDGAPKSSGRRTFDGGARDPAMTTTTTTTNASTTTTKIRGAKVENKKAHSKKGGGLDFGVGPRPKGGDASAGGEASYAWSAFQSSPDPSALPLPEFKPSGSSLLPDASTSFLEDPAFSSSSTHSSGRPTPDPRASSTTKAGNGDKAGVEAEAEAEAKEHLEAEARTEPRSPAPAELTRGAMESLLRGAILGKNHGVGVGNGATTANASPPPKGAVFAEDLEAEVIAAAERAAKLEIAGNGASDATHEGADDAERDDDEGRAGAQEGTQGPEEVDNEDDKEDEDEPSAELIREGGGVNLAALASPKSDISKRGEVDGSAGSVGPSPRSSPLDRPLWRDDQEKADFDPIAQLMNVQGYQVPLSPHQHHAPQHHGMHPVPPPPLQHFPQQHGMHPAGPYGQPHYLRMMHPSQHGYPPQQQQQQQQQHAPHHHGPHHHSGGFSHHHPHHLGPPGGGVGGGGYVTVQVQVPPTLLPGRRMLVPSPLSPGAIVEVTVPEGIQSGAVVPVTIPAGIPGPGPGPCPGPGRGPGPGPGPHRGGMMPSVPLQASHGMMPHGEQPHMPLSPQQAQAQYYQQAQMHMYMQQQQQQRAHAHAHQMRQQQLLPQQQGPKPGTWAAKAAAPPGGEVGSEK